MTVGQELTKITDLHLFHNHIMFEVIMDHFGKYFGNVTDRLKDVIFEEYSKSDNYGLIYTACLSFDHQNDWDFIHHITKIFKEANAEIYIVELIASQEIRLERNKTENRLHHKATKRDIIKSQENLLNADTIGRFESHEGEIPFENYVKINNSNLAPHTVATVIKEKFQL